MAMPLRVAIKPEVGIEPIGLRYSLWIAMKKRNEDNEPGIGGNRQAANGGGLCRLKYQKRRCRPQAHRESMLARGAPSCVATSRIAPCWTEG